MYYMAVPPFLYAQICSALRPVAASAQVSAQASARASPKVSPLCGPSVAASSQGEPLMSSLSLHEGGAAPAPVGPFAAAAAAAAATSAAGQSREERFSNGEERDQLAALADPLDGIETVERFVLEKPFGRDSASCAAMIRELAFIPEEARRMHAACAPHARRMHTAHRYTRPPPHRHPHQSPLFALTLSLTHPSLGRSSTGSITTWARSS